ncbi:hypothetical protein [Chitinophaga vietnamensis]|uniref:hypothetical protein n=1 Tax=Chitinophaga vietnamensis TaxID=2593957 RepID=UPI001177B10C|nr:hypothetical protein [Chitinophaga vietnamensis]
MKHLLTALFLFAASHAFAQSQSDNDPVFVLDSAVVASGALQQMAPSQIAIITVAKGAGPKTVAKYGARAENGVVYVETITFARNRIRKFLSSQSPAYDSLLRKHHGTDTAFCYFVNNKQATPTNGSRLYAIDMKTFRGLEILSGKPLQEKQPGKDCEIGVFISSSED